jgi:hypothetical protein
VQPVVLACTQLIFHVWAIYHRPSWVAHAQAHGLLPPWPFLEQARARALPTLCLSAFANEGDNRQEGLQLAVASLRWLHAMKLLDEAAATSMGLEPSSQSQNVKLCIPCSWHAVFGPGMPAA